MSARHLRTVLREDLVLVVVVALVVLAGSGLVAGLRPDRFTSTATFYVASPQATTSTTDSYQGAQLSAERVSSYVELLTGPRVADDASRLLGGSPTADRIQSAIGADSVSGSVIITMTVTERSPGEARLVGEAVAEAFARLVRTLESTGQPVNQPVVVTRLIVPPSTPVAPDGPGPAVLVVVALLVGPVLGLGVAVARRRWRRAVPDADALAGALGAPVLGRVPPPRRGTGTLAVLASPPAGRTDARSRSLRARAEAYRRLRSNLRSVSGASSSVAVTGVSGGQATSTVALELAMMLADDGERVVLVDADLHAPRVGRTVGLGDEAGLGDVLAGSVRLTDAVRPWPVGGIDVLPAGSPGPHPTELLGGSAAVLAALAERYDRVVVDVASATEAAAAVDLGPLVDGVLVVARREEARLAAVRSAAEALRLVGSRIVGGVLTDAGDVPETPAGVRGADVGRLAARAPLALPPGPSAPGATADDGESEDPEEPEDPQARTVSSARNQS